MQRVSSTACSVNPALTLTLLLLLLLPAVVLSQQFTFKTVTTSLPWSPRSQPGAILTTRTLSQLGLLGGSDGGSDNDVWISQPYPAFDAWWMECGTSVVGSAPVPYANVSFPPTIGAALAFQFPSLLAFHYGGYSLLPDGSSVPSTDTYVASGDVVWTRATYPADSPAPAYRDLPPSIVTTSDTPKDGSFLLVGGFESDTRDVSSSSLIWKSSAAAIGQPEVRKWTVVGGMRTAANHTFISANAPVVMGKGWLNKDILYLLGGMDASTGDVSDAIWASSDQGTGNTPHRCTLYLLLRCCCWYGVGD